MKLPEGYTLLEVLSPGPVTVVARVRGPGPMDGPRDWDEHGQACVAKAAAIERGRELVVREGDVLEALARAGVSAVPRLTARTAEVIVMEEIAGPVLYACGEAMRGDAARRVRFARAAFDALAAVHGARDASGPLGVVHGDVSPGNLYETHGGVTVADFGLARWRGGAPGRDGVVRGTLDYIAPEAARSEPWDGRADDFALAASILHVVTGVALHPPARALALALARAAEEPLAADHPWRQRARQLFPSTVASALLACLAFDPRDRPPETPRPR